MLVLNGISSIWRIFAIKYYYKWKIPVKIELLFQESYKFVHYLWESAYLAGILRGWFWFYVKSGGIAFSLSNKFCNSTGKNVMGCACYIKGLNDKKF